MHRRTFVLLTGAATGAMLVPPFPRSPTPAPVGRLRVTLDDQRRWSLWYQGGAAPVPLLDRAEMGAWIGDRLVTLADLQDTAIGNRRPPAGESLVLRGRAEGVYVEAEFVTGEPGPAPQASVSMSVYPDRHLPTCRGVRYFTVPNVGVLPGAEPLTALVNGYHSGSACQVARLPLRAGELASHAALGLTRGRHALGIAFDPGEAGEGTIRLTPEGLAAVSDWLPPRPLRPQGDSSVLRLAYQPGADGLAALATLFEPGSPVDRERLASLAVPTGWCSRHALAGRVTEDGLIANLEFCAATFDRRHFGYVQLDDGYQRAAGDWEVNDAFPHGHRWLTDRIHAHGLRAGIWIAPFAVAERSGLPAAHPDWLVRDGTGPLVRDTREDWGGRTYGLDGAHPEVQQWLYQLARRIVGDWGYDCVKLGFLHWATGGTVYHGGLTHAEAYRRGLAAIRDGVGPDVFIQAGDAPLQHAQGLVNGMRIGADVDASWSGTQVAARAASLRSFYHRGAWFNDPDALLVGPALSEREAQAWASVVAASGGLTLFSDDLPTLAPERVAILRRTLPVARVAGRPVGALAENRTVAPAIVVGDEAPPLDRPAAVWVTEAAPRWWTVVLINWNDEPSEVSVPLGDLGITGQRFAAYDVWRDAPLPDVRERVTATLEAHHALTVALRPVARHPQVIGTTRHVIQGAVDLAEERWDTATRTLRGRSTAQDGNAYAVTMAVPGTLRPTTCQADPPCETRRLETGHVVLSWPEGRDGRDLNWEVRFRTVRRR